MSSKLHPLRTLHLFAGAGGGILGDLLLGHRPICAVEIEPYCQQVLSSRQKDGFLPWFPIYNDVQTFDGRPWRGVVDVVSGGFPCQDISAAGKGAGITGERSGMWKHMARIIGEVRPRYVLVENSPVLTSRGLDVVLGDLAAMGYDAEWGVVGADDAGAPHRRERIWIVAYTAGDRMEKPFVLDADLLGGPSDATPEQVDTKPRQHPIGQLAHADMLGRVHGQTGEFTAEGWVHAQREPEPSGEDVADAVSYRRGLQRDEIRDGAGAEGGKASDACNGSAVGSWWSTEPDVGGNVDGLAKKMDCA